MAACTPQGSNLLFGLRRSKRFDKGLAAKLPPAYLKFYKEWKETKPTAVHYIPKSGKFERDEITGLVRAVQNIPFPIVYPPEHNDGIWGGEGVVKGFQKRAQTKRRVPHMWIPSLRRSVVYSTVLNQYMSVIVTDRTIDLIHDNLGFDHYLLKTPACDLKSTLALGIKRKILQSLKSGCPEWNNQAKQSEILKEYAKYAEQYTPEEIEWYGLSFNDAIKKISQILKAQETIQPQKIEFRSQLIQQLREAGINEAQPNTADSSSDDLPTSSSWLSKMNPFGKKQET